MAEVDWLTWLAQVVVFKKEKLRYLIGGPFQKDISKKVTIFCLICGRPKICGCNALEGQLQAERTVRLCNQIGAF